MKKIIILVLYCVSQLSGCGSSSSTNDEMDYGHQWLPPGGAATLTFDAEFPFLQFVPDLDILKFPDASRGRELFVADWEAAPGSRPTLDGFGPLAITNACDNCHLPKGRAASLLEDGRTDVGILFRLGREDGVVDSHFGAQLQSVATVGSSEGTVRWSMHTEKDKPVFSFIENSYALDDNINLGPRLSPQLVGVGLLELIPESTILAWEDEDDHDQNGISGRVHWRNNAIGRFGWKAIAPTLESQTAAALQQDMGLTSSIRIEENCTSLQDICSTQSNGGSPEVSEHGLSAINTFLTLLAVPDRRIREQEDFNLGAEMFDQVGCSGCHRPFITTGNSEDYPFLSNQIIYPYTDLLLHDMGNELSDGVREGDALAQEWRTPPLWSLGLIEQVEGSRFLHDGRAENIEQAILWHGGEALAARENYEQLSAEDKLILLDFLRAI